MSVKHDITEESLIAAGYRALHAGDDYTYQFTVTRGGTALDLTSAKVWLTIKESSVEVDASAKLQYDSSTAAITITSPTNGQFTVTFTAADTADLEGEWLYDIKAKLADTTLIRLARGKIEFLANLTRATT